MNERQSKLLAAIINQFIDTAIPVGSIHLMQSNVFNVSGATIRNEMRLLGEEGYLDQPHVSAGRVPTAKGYRMYVRDYLDPSTHEKKVRKQFDTLREQYTQRKDQERVYDAVSLLSSMMPDIAFATVPYKDRVYYLGLANVLKQPEFQDDPKLAAGVVEVVEEHMSDVLSTVNVDDKIRYYIGEEHILPQIQSCSFMVTEYDLGGKKGALGILGPMRMDYAYNTVTLDLVVDLLRSAS